MKFRFAIHRRANSRSRAVRLWATAALAFISTQASAQGGLMAPYVTDSRSQEKVARYKPSQINPPIPKYEYAEDGRVILVKRYPFFPAQDMCQFVKYRYYENKTGVEHIAMGQKLKREPDEILSEVQKQILRDWGQPDYLRGPYKSTRGDSIIEWAYLPLNRLFQFVDREMVYEGPLTDQERTAITYGAPRDVFVSQVGPNIRREVWIYYPYFLTGRQRMYSFANGKLVYSQESP